MKPNLLAALLCGVVFAAGLLIGGMTQPSKVVGFLDLLGDWDPSLAFVMGGALLVHTLAGRVIRRRARPILDTQFHVPSRRDLDRRLIAGAALFGIGWGLAGYCPGPALVSLAAAGPALIFVLAMLAGMGLHRLTA